MRIKSVLTVQELLDLYPCLGLPHFQRGSVWSDEARSLLLESLFYDTPCGTVVLWKPRKAVGDDGGGIPLDDNELERVTHLVVDGQQRLRALRDIFLECSVDEVESELSDSGEVLDSAIPASNGSGPPRRWCVNLQAYPPMAGLLMGELDKFPMFVRITDPTRPGAGQEDRRNKRFRKNLIPVTDLVAGGTQFEQAILRYEIQPNGDVRVRLEQLWPALCLGIAAMKGRRLFVIEKKETGSRWGLGEVVELYNRINSAGIRVQAEEKVFASLAAVAGRQTQEWLEQTFSLVHAPDSQDPQRKAGIERRDSLMRRSQERYFGFRFFVQSLVEVLGYHWGYVEGSGPLWSQLQRTGHRVRELKRKEREGKVLRKLYGETSSIVETLAVVLGVRRSESGLPSLFCDSFAFLPDTAMLVPARELLTVYPRNLSTSLRHLSSAITVEPPGQRRQGHLAGCCPRVRPAARRPLQSAG